jgi:hypothetical protein
VVLCHSGGGGSSGEEADAVDKSHHLHYPDTSMKLRNGIAIHIRYSDIPIRHRYGIGEVSGKYNNKKNKLNPDT